MTLQGDGMWEFIQSNSQTFTDSFIEDTASIIGVQSRYITNVQASLASSNKLLADESVSVSFDISSIASSTKTALQLGQAFQTKVNEGSASFTSIESASGVEVEAEVQSASGVKAEAEVESVSGVKVEVEVESASSVKVEEKSSAASGQSVNDEGESPAGIIVGALFGGACLIAGVQFILWYRRRQATDKTVTVGPMPETQLGTKDNEDAVVLPVAHGRLPPLGGVASMNAAALQTEEDTPVEPKSELDWDV
jgi:hypothetical protein